MSKGLISAVLVCLLMLTGCLGTYTHEAGDQGEAWLGPTPPPTVRGLLITLTDEQIEYVQQGVRNVLKDPDSAVFGRIIAGALNASHASLVVCGWVNAKNSFGGYTGDKPFIGTVEGVFIETAFTLSDIGDTDTEALAVLILCDHYGLSLDAY